MGTWPYKFNSIELLNLFLGFNLKWVILLNLFLWVIGAQASAPSSSGDGRLLLLSVAGGSGIYGSFFLCAAQKLSMMKFILSLFCTRRSDNNFDLSTTLL